LQVPVQRGFFHPVVRPPLQSYILRGAWTISVDPASGRAEASWEEKLGISLIFLQGEDVITVLGRPAHAFPEQELEAVALSLLSPESMELK